MNGLIKNLYIYICYYDTIFFKYYSIHVYITLYINIYMLFFFYSQISNIGKI